MVATPTAALTAGLLAPTILTFMMDARTGRALTRTVGLSGLAAAVHPLMTLWSGGHTIELATLLLSEPTNFLIAWSAQGAGWLLAQTLPVLLTASVVAQTEARGARLRRMRRELEIEWELPANMQVIPNP